MQAGAPPCSALVRPGSQAPAWEPTAVGALPPDLLNFPHSALRRALYL